MHMSIRTATLHSTNLYQTLFNRCSKVKVGWTFQTKNKYILIHYKQYLQSPFIVTTVLTLVQGNKREHTQLMLKQYSTGLFCTAGYDYDVIYSTKVLLPVGINDMFLPVQPWERILVCMHLKTRCHTHYLVCLFIQDISTLKVIGEYNNQWKIKHI